MSDFSEQDPMDLLGKLFGGLKNLGNGVYAGDFSSLIGDREKEEYITVGVLDKDECKLFTNLTKSKEECTELNNKLMEKMNIFISHRNRMMSTVEINHNLSGKDFRIDPKTSEILIRKEKDDLDPKKEDN